MTIVIVKTDSGYSGTVTIAGKKRRNAVGDTVSDVINLLALHSL